MFLFCLFVVSLGLFVVYCFGFFFLPLATATTGSGKVPPLY